MKTKDQGEVKLCLCARKQFYYSQEDEHIHQGEVKLLVYLLKTEFNTSTAFWAAAKFVFEFSLFSICFIEFFWDAPLFLSAFCSYICWSFSRLLFLYMLVLFFARETKFCSKFQATKSRCIWNDYEMMSFIVLCICRFMQRNLITNWNEIFLQFALSKLETLPC